MDMNLKTALVTFVIPLLLASLLVGVYVVKSDDAVSMVFSGGVALYSPINITYSSNFLTLNLIFTCGAGVHYSLNYSIDNEPSQSPIPLVYNGSGGFQMFAPEYGLVQLPELSKGSHSLTIYEQALIPDYHGANAPGAPFKPTASGSSDYVAYWTDTVDFSINSTATTQQFPPTITNLSVKNQTYTTHDVPLNFIVNQNITAAAYSLDGESYVTIAGNSTLNGLGVGTHNITVYVWNDAGSIGLSGTVNFTVTNPPSVASQSSEPLAAELVLFLVTAIAVVIGSCLIYLKYRKR
jgi:hypothetical protein